MKNQEEKILEKRNVVQILLTITFCIFLLLVPIIPDIQIVRPKLLTIEIITYFGVIILVFMTIFNNKFYYRKTKIFYLLFLLVLYIIFHYIFSSDKSLALSELKRWLLSITVLYLVATIEWKYHKWLIGCLLIGSSLAVIYGFLQYRGGIWRIQVPQMSRVMSMFGNPIFFAVHIINFFPILLSVLLLEFKKRFVSIKSLVLAGLCVLTLVTLYYTKTRAAFIGFVVSMLVFVYMNIKSLRNKLLFSICIGIIFTTFVIFTQHIWRRQQAHLLIWRDTLKMWSSRPLQGVGIGKFHTEFVNFASQELRDIWPQREFIINDAHNEYVQLLSETGVFGMILFISFLFIFFKEGIKKISVQNYENKILLSGIISGIIAVLIQNIFSVDMRFIISSVYIFLCIGLVLGNIYPLEVKTLIFKNLWLKLFTFIPFLFLSGIISFESKLFRLSFLSIIHFSSNRITFGLDDVGNGLLQQILRPYVAHYKFKKQPDFFDEKIVNAAKSLQELFELRDKFPDKAIIYEKIAWIYAKERQFDKAIENYLQAIKLNPQSFGAFNNLGNIMFLLNKRQEAIKFYTQSIQINPNQIDARLNLGIAHYYEGQLNLAAEQFDKVLSLDPKNEKAIVMLKKMRE